MTCEIIAHLLTRGLETALNAAAAEVVRIQHPKFAARTVCEFNPDHVNEEHKLARTKSRGRALNKGCRATARTTQSALRTHRPADGCLDAIRRFVSAVGVTVG
jgi:hypothetical protein